MYKYYNPVHSDYIIHWTGKDIDKDQVWTNAQLLKTNIKDPVWTDFHSSITNPEVNELYLERLKYILKYGLWMTKNEEDKYLKINGECIERPSPARTCFTELKLSDVRSHAAEYGRLGIGFKRFFLLDRLGSPMMYYQPNRKNWFFPHYLSNRKQYNSNDYFACFLKHMTREANDNTLEYKYYDESEWRIIYSDDIKSKLEKLNKNSITKQFKKPSSIDDEKFQKYISQNRFKPEFLIPIKDPRLIPVKNPWFCMIIYPNLAIKVEAEADNEIRKLIEEIKPTKPPNIKVGKHINFALLEMYSKPIEIDLDALKRFIGSKTPSLSLNNY